MTLEEIIIPSDFPEMIKVFESYYNSFHVDMMRISTPNLNSHIDSYLHRVDKLSRFPLTENSIRAAMGVVCLHRFGYKNFGELTRVFDRLLPQTDREYVKFTSWCAGKLIHHPNVQQSSYVVHLFDRSIRWIYARGRRARPLAAAFLLNALAGNAQSTVVAFFSSLQYAVWGLVSQSSSEVLSVTADAISSYTKAIVNYGGVDLHEYLTFFYKLGSNLLGSGDPINEYGALMIYEVLIKICHDGFIPNVNQFYQDIIEAVTDEPVIVQGSALRTIASLSLVDPMHFLEIISSDFFEMCSEFAEDCPMDLVESISLLCETVPNLIEAKMELILEFAERIKGQPEIILLAKVLETFKGMVDLTSIDVASLTKEEITPAFCHFFTVYFSQVKVTKEDLRISLAQKVLTELTGKNHDMVLKFVADLPWEIFGEQPEITAAIRKLARCESIQTRSLVAPALFRLLGQDRAKVAVEVLRWATCDTSHHVREAMLEAVSSAYCVEMATKEIISILERFMYDESSHVRQVLFRILGQVSTTNQLIVTGMTREALRESFFIIRNIKSLKQRSRYVAELPDLVKAASLTVKGFAASFMEIVVSVLADHSPSMKFETFLEEDAYKRILISIMDSVSLLAPMDPEQVAAYGDVMIPMICDLILSTDCRKLCLSILNLLLVLLSAPASNISYRDKAPMILRTCSTLMASTQSRRVRMRTLKVIGAVGVLEVHQSRPLMGCKAPENLDEDLIRDFFHPIREVEVEEDKYVWLRKTESGERDFTLFAAGYLLETFNDENSKAIYEDIVKSLVQLLRNPKMAVLRLFDAFVARLLDVLKTSTIAMAQGLLPLFRDLINGSGQNVAPFFQQSFDVIRSRYCSELANEILEVLVSFAWALRDGISPFGPDILCWLMEVLEGNASSGKIVKGILEAFKTIAIFSHSVVTFVIPLLCDLIVSDRIETSARISGVQTLKWLAKRIDLSRYFGLIIRIIAECVRNPDYTNAVMKLLKAMIKSHGKDFIVNAMPLLNEVASEDLMVFVSGVERGDIEVGWKEIPGPKDQQLDDSGTLSYNEHEILMRLMSPGVGYGKHVEQWLHTFRLACIEHSPSKAIRCCHAVSLWSHHFGMQLFKPAFLSCWDKTSKNGRDDIAEWMDTILVSPENHEIVVRCIVDLLAFMDRMGSPIPCAPESIVKASEHYGGFAFALYTEQKLYEEHPNPEHGRNLINVLVALGDWSNATGLWKQLDLRDNTVNDMAHLRMWDVVEPIYREIFKQDGDFGSFKGLSQAWASLAMWPQLWEHIAFFERLERAQKREVAIYYAEAALHLGEWDSLEQILKYAPQDAPRTYALDVINRMRFGNVDEIQEELEKGYSCLASKPMVFSGDNQQISRSIARAAEEFVELCEMKRAVAKWVSSSAIYEVWSDRLKTAPRDFDLWFSLLSNRARILQIGDDNLIEFFQLRSETMGTNLHMNAFKLLFPDFDFEHSRELEKVCFLVVNWNTGEKIWALNQMKELAKTVQGQLGNRCHVFCAEWLMDRLSDLGDVKEAYDHLKVVIEGIDWKSKLEGQHSPKSRCAVIDGKWKAVSEKIRNTTFGRDTLTLPSQVRKELTTDHQSIGYLRKWAYVNSYLIEEDKENVTVYVKQAISAFTRAAELEPTFPDVVQLLHLFFDYADRQDVLLAGKECIEKLQAKLLLQAIPQLLIQLDHKSAPVVEFVQSIVNKMLQEHFHDLAFSIIVTSMSKNARRAKAANDILEQFRQSKTEVYDEIHLIRDALLMAAVTWRELAKEKITEAISNGQRGRIDKVRQALSEICILKEKSEQKCEMHREFVRSYRWQLDNLGKLLKDGSSNNGLWLSRCRQWCMSMMGLIKEDMFRTIQLSSISQTLSEKTGFFLAVPGTYRPNKPVNHIKYFVRQLEVYTSKQMPKDVVIRGEDGRFYQYLLKGHEDLRLDERIMQFFRMINSLIVKDSVFTQNRIETTSVITLSLTQGLVQWIPGTYTLRYIIEQERKNRKVGADGHEREILEAKCVAAQYDDMLPIHKLYLLKQIFAKVADTPLSDFFWRRSTSAEKWVQQTNTFAISSGITSIVGYILGLGDRHPSNLLVDRLTGKVIHIDFGDCFGKSERRAILPEKVPFRLTRMMIRAMGPARVGGLFKTSFVRMAQILRSNKNILAMVLATFVHEPLVDVNDHRESGKSSVHAPSELRNYIMKKLTGSERDQSKPMSVDEQSDWLIASATSDYNLARMYSGWCPWW